MNLGFLGSVAQSAAMAALPPPAKAAVEAGTAVFNYARRACHIVNNPEQALNPKQALKRVITHLLPGNNPGQTVNATA